LGGVPFYYDPFAIERKSMSYKVLVIGGVALGPKAASRCKRLMPEADITLIDENNYISYGGCGLPYYISGEINNLDDLRATPYHTIRDPQFFADMKGVKVKNQTRALAIDRAAKTVLVKNLVTGQQENLPYDKLVLATGAKPRMPPVPGHDLQGVHSVTRMEAAGIIRQACQEGKVEKAVIVGAGFIGLEVAVALADMWGVECSVVEMMPQMLPGVLSANFGKMAEHDFAQHKVALYADEKVLRLEGSEGHVCKVITDKRELDAQLVIFAAGFLPNGQLAKDAGLEVAPFGAVVVNEHMQSSDPDIYAGGDCCAIPNLITGKVGYLPLGSLANRQGRIIGTNLAGGDSTFAGYVGTWAVKLFDMSFCGVGLTIERARKEGYDAVSVAVEQLDRAHFYPEKNMMSLELVVEKGTRRVLGMQGACTAGDALKARIDAVAGVLQYSKPTLDDIANLEVAYAPPFASAMDIVNAVANAADNVLAGRFNTATASEFMELWKNRAENKLFFIDARPKAGSKALAEQYPDAWHGISMEEIITGAVEIPEHVDVALICNTGLRSYEAELVLQRKGHTVINSMGGMQAVMKTGGVI
jgi:NADPH-dependent 2,4-dienoyl-CoA reductase/sulfur reductase-like enzyme/rhodanese-related sulfurtransferase